MCVLAGAYLRASVLACVRANVHACERACVRACAHEYFYETRTKPSRTLLSKLTRRCATRRRYVDVVPSVDGTRRSHHSGLHVITGAGEAAQTAITRLTDGAARRCVGRRQTLDTKVGTKSEIHAFVDIIAKPFTRNVENCRGTRLVYLTVDIVVCVVEEYRQWLKPSPDMKGCVIR